MAFMKVEIVQNEQYRLVECEDGASYLVLGMFEDSNNPKDYKLYTPSKPVKVSRRRRGKYISRLSAEGYTDCTEWEVHDSYRELCHYWVQEQDVDQNGDDIDWELIPKGTSTKAVFEGNYKKKEAKP